MPPLLNIRKDIIIEKIKLIPKDLSTDALKIATENGASIDFGSSLVCKGMREYYIMQRIPGAKKRKSLVSLIVCNYDNNKETIARRMSRFITGEYRPKNTTAVEIC